MKNLKCPDCSSQAVSKREKFRASMFGSSINCLSCSASLKTGGGLISNIIGSVSGSVFLYVIIFSVANNSWLYVIAALITTWFLISIVIFYSSLKLVGRKQLRI